MCPNGAKGSIMSRSDDTARMGAGKVLLIVFGALLALVAVGLLIGGGALMWIESALKDSEGFYTTRTVSLTRDSYAIVSEPAQIDLGPAWIPDWSRSVTVKVEATSSQPSKGLFIGIAEEGAASAYLAGVEHDEITELDIWKRKVEYRHRPGGSPPAAPASGTFWVASAYGPGTQTLKWDLEEGSYLLVLMNEDGSRGIDLQGTIAARVPWLPGVGIGLLLGGIAVLVIGLVLIVLGARGAPPIPQPSEPEPAGYPFVFKGELTEPFSPWLWLVKWFLLIPHFILLAFLWAGFIVSWVISLFAILFTGRYPRGLFDYNLGVLRWTWRVGFYGYQALGTDEYPPFTLSHADYPADLDVPYPERLSRGLALVKWWLLAIPHYMVIAFFQGGGGGRSGGGLVYVLALFAGVALLFTGRYPKGIFDFVFGMNRWTYRVAAYTALMTDRYPPFRLGE